PAAIGGACEKRVATPAVASAPPRWKPSWSATNASPWHARTTGTNARRAPAATAGSGAPSPAAGGVERPGGGPEPRTGGEDAQPRPSCRQRECPRDSDPTGDRDPGPVAVDVALSRQRDAE